MVENVVIFGLKTCTHCKSLKKRLDELSIVYIDVDVHANDENKQLWSQIVEQTKNELVPTVFLKIKNTNSGPIYVPGRDFKNEDEIVEIIKSHI